ncbi:MAG: hypothetical protein ACOYJQ_01185 [Pseudochelatococcus sp.]|uniref:hypothetical protein n=1 Tax=Pseudochelatococcus sp. TaxID=2020869 RepID=UPI003D8DAFD6
MSYASGVIAALTGVFILGASPYGGEAEGPSLFSLLVPSAAHAASDVELKSIAIAAEGLEVAIPAATVTGSNLPEAALRGLFDLPAAGSRAGASWAERLGALSATSIVIPQLSVTQNGGGARQITTYFDVELRDIVNGVIGSARSGRSTITFKPDESAGDAAAFAGTTGAVSVEKIDTTLIARLFSGDGKPAGDAEPAHLLHGVFSIADYRLTGAPDGGEGGFSLAIDSIAGDGMSVRPGSVPIADIFQLANKGSDIETLSADEKRKLLAGVAGILSGIDLGTTTASGLVVSSTDTGTQDDGYALRIATLKTRFADQVLEIGLDGIAFESGDGTVSVAAASLENLSFRSAVSALAEAARSTSEDPEAVLADARIAPSGGRFRIENVAVDLAIDDDTEVDQDANAGQAAGGSADAGAPERIRFSIASFATATDLGTGGGDAQFDTVLTGLRASLPQSDEDGIRQLRELGYDEVTLSAALLGRWTADTKELSLETLSLSGEEIGALALQARLGRVDGEFFSGDPDKALQALSGSALHSFSLTLENKGVFERIVKLQAGAGGVSADDVRQQFAALALIGLPAIIGDSAAAKKIAAAVSRFATSPRKLVLKATAKDPAGVGIETIDPATMGPGAVLERFDVITANE